MYVESIHGTTEVLIDIDDIQKLKELDLTFNLWYKEGCDLYIKACKRMNIDGNNIKRSIWLHRFLLNAQEGEEVDHINHNTLDNRKQNLRIVNSTQNKQNKKGANKNSKTKIRGVFWDKNKGKYIAQITMNYKAITIGAFDSIGEAEKAVIDARKS